ncbi:MAG: hypothetical protein ACLGJB_07285 [Blastocatellia bacterium]
MDYLRLEFPLWYLVGILVLTKSVALTLLIYKRRRTRKGAPVKVGSSSEAAAQADSGRMVVELERMRAGESIDEEHMRRMSAEDKAMFEVQLIDALTKGSREDRHRLRSALIKVGYDEACARRVMRASVSDRVRAKTLLGLLRPQSQGRTGELVQPPKAGHLDPGPGAGAGASQESSGQVEGEGRGE